MPFPCTPVSIHLYYHNQPRIHLAKLGGWQRWVPVSSSIMYVGGLYAGFGISHVLYRVYSVHVWKISCTKWHQAFIAFLPLNQTKYPLSGWLVGWRMGGRADESTDRQTGGLAWSADNGVVARWRWWFWFRIWCWWLVMHVLEFSQFHLNTYIYSNGKQETCIQIYAYLYKVYLASCSLVIASHPQGMRWVIHVARFLWCLYVSLFKNLYKHI